MTETGAARQVHGQSGVSLIEMVVALAIIAVALALAGTGMRLLGRSGERGAAVIARHDILSRGIDVLRRDIERLERVELKRGAGRGQLAFHGHATRLILVAVEPPFPTEPGPYFIVYTVEQRPDGTTLTRERAPFNAAALDMQRLPTQDAVAVIEGAYRLRFLYLDRKGGRDRWLAQWPDPARLPTLIALEIAGLGGTAMPPVIFRPRIDAQSGCAQDGGSCSPDSDAVPQRGGG
jgi:general secretion pathway protein J